MGKLEQRIAALEIENKQLVQKYKRMEGLVLDAVEAMQKLNTKQHDLHSKVTGLLFQIKFKLDILGRQIRELMRGHGK